MSIVSISAAIVGIATLVLAKPAVAQAVCPVCTVAVASGLGFSRYLGIDDTVSGIWFGGLIVSTGMWLANWIRSKHWKVPYLYPLCLIGMFVLTVVPLYWMGLMGHPLNTLWGIDKLLLGLLVGVGLFLLSLLIETFLRLSHEGKAYVPFQKVLVPVVLLALSSLIFYFITR